MYYCRAIVIGDIGTGKSSILQSLVAGTFTEKHEPTIGIDLHITTVPLSGNTTSSVKFQFRDTSGQERFQSVSRLYYRGADVIVLVFDVTDRYTFDRLDHWYHQALLHGEPDAILIVLGNKVDLDKPEVSWDEVVAWCRERHVEFYSQVSAKTKRDPIVRIFQDVAAKFVKENGKSTSVFAIEDNNHDSQAGDDDKVNFRNLSKSPSSSLFCCSPG